MPSLQRTDTPPRCFERNFPSSTASDTDSEDEPLDHIVAGEFSRPYVGLGKVADFIDEIDGDVDWVIRFPGEPDPGNVFKTLFPKADRGGIIVWMLVTKSVADVYDHLMGDAERFCTRNRNRPCCACRFTEYTVAKLSPTCVGILGGRALVE